MVTLDLAGGATGNDLKKKLEPLVQRVVEEQRLLTRGGSGKDMKVLEDNVSLAAQGVANDGVIFLVLKDGTGWEKVNVVPFSSSAPS